MYREITFSSLCEWKKELETRYGRVQLNYADGMLKAVRPGECKSIGYFDTIDNNGYVKVLDE